MVNINSLHAKGLYSFDKEFSISLSNRVLIVGPNNSGKSNFFRIIMLVISALNGNRSLKEYEISPSANKSLIELEVKFSKEEVELIVNYLSFYLAENGQKSYFYEFKHKEILSKLMSNVIIKLEWPREVRGESSYPILEIKFPKIGLNLSNLLYAGQLIASTKSYESVKSHYDSKEKICEILDLISDEKNAFDIISQKLGNVTSFPMLYSIRIQPNDNEMPNEGIEVLRKMYSILDIKMDNVRDISFQSILGKMLKNGIRFSSGTRAVQPYNIFEYIDEILLSTDLQDPQKQRFVQDIQDNNQLKNLEFSNILKNDGSNIAQFLYSIKNSPLPRERKKFEDIRSLFNEIFKKYNLELEVTVEFTTRPYQRVFVDKEPKVPLRPKIQILDKRLEKEFPLENIASGVKETLYLLALSMGMSHSTILLDEPAINLHPSLMRTLMDKIQNSENDDQFLIITHSPELAAYEIFESNAEIIYVSYRGTTSIISQLSDDIKKWLKENRINLKHQIDSRIFFGQLVILTEGDSDRNLLGLSHFLESSENNLDVKGNDVIVIDIGGVNNFEKYLKLLKDLDIRYMALADRHAKSKFPNHGVITKNGISGDGNIFIIDASEKGNLEDLMNDIDPKAYASAKKDFNSKPAIAYEFAKLVSAQRPDALKPIISFLKMAIENANKS